MYILTYTGTWNNQINVDGFIIINKEKKKKIIKCLNDYDEIIYISNGGDDETEYENGKELLDELSFEKISNDFELKTIKKFFGEFNDYGHNVLLDIKKLFNREKCY